MTNDAYPMRWQRYKYDDDRPCYDDTNTNPKANPISNTPSNPTTRLIYHQVNAGDDLIRQGDNGDYFYIIETGVFVIIVNGNQVAELHAGRSFGELSLMFCTPRAATVRAVTTSMVFALDRDTFRMVLANGHIQKNKDISDGLNKVPLLAGLTEAQIAKITGHICFIVILSEPKHLP